MDIIVGTAGHIDHGKTALVKALTGVDADRLPEEKRRGITIDLGFAELEHGDIRFGFVDVPGHERFVKNMLAGASGIDIVLLVIAADEGVMPQTREHFDICRLLRIKNGLVVLTKAELVNEEMLDLVKGETDELIRDTFLENAPMVAVDSVTGRGIGQLKSALVAIARSVKTRSDDLIARLPIDRSFSMKGFGGVVTGTLASGKIVEGSELELLPIKKRVRVRGVQSHGRTVMEATAGRRTAVNLGGVTYSDVERGMLLAEPSVLEPAQIFDAEIEVLSEAARPLRSRQRVRVHIGTAEVLARLAVISENGEIGPGEVGFAQLRLESPVAAVAHERFIIRQYSPQVTIAGGAVLRPAPGKFARREAQPLIEQLTRLSAAATDRSETFRLLVEFAGRQGTDVGRVRSITGWRRDIFDAVAKRLVDSKSVIECDGVFIDASVFNDLRSKVLRETEILHRADPLARGVSLEVLRERVFRHVRPEVIDPVLNSLASENKLSVEGESVRLSTFSTQLSENETRALEHLRRVYTSAGLEAPKLEDALSEASQKYAVDRTTVRKLFNQLCSTGEIEQVSNELYVAKNVVNELIGKVRQYADASADRMIDVATFKNIAGVSRKFAIPLLEYLDLRKVTARRGDKRLII
jgi:selenocysteine-specific elongation factor